MPKTINPAAKWTDQIDVPRAGEGVKAAGVELPFSDVLANTKQLKNLIADLQTRVDGLQTGSNSGTDAPDLSAAVAALDTRVDHLEAAATAGNAAGVGTAIDGLNAGLAALTTRVAALEASKNETKNPADFHIIPTVRATNDLRITLVPRDIMDNANYQWSVVFPDGGITKFYGAVVLLDPVYINNSSPVKSMTLTVTDSGGQAHSMTKSFPGIAQGQI